MAEFKNFEEYHKSYELHWDLRRRFLQVHEDKFSTDRLLCMSNVFINVTCYGARYPQQVMKIVEMLGAEIRGNGH